MDVDSKGFVYIGQNTVRKYDPKTGKMVAEVPHVPETPQGQPFIAPTLPTRVPGQGSAGPVAGFITVPAAGGGGRGGRGNQADAAAQEAAFRRKYPPTTPMIVGGIEEIRIDEPANEIYMADNYLGGRVMVFSLDAFAFKRGWGATGTNSRKSPPMTPASRRRESGIPFNQTGGPGRHNEITNMSFPFAAVLMLPLVRGGDAQAGKAL